MIELVAPAKLNLGLGVVGRRRDGFHELDTLMVGLDLSDRVRLTALAGPEIEGASLPSRDHYVAASAPPMDRDNLALRAARAYLEAAGWPGGVRIGLAKEIPVAAGLGGGSSDAGAVLRGLALLYPCGLDLVELAAGIGSDVPFFVTSAKAARGRGRGELLEPVAVPPGHAVLVNPGVQISAATAYGWLVAPRGALDVPGIVTALRSGKSPRYRNDLQAGVVDRTPAVAAALAALEGVGLAGVSMSGSGATCFGLAGDEPQARRAEADLRAAHPNWWVRAVRFPHPSASAGRAD